MTYNHVHALRYLVIAVLAQKSPEHDVAEHIEHFPGNMFSMTPYGKSMLFNENSLLPKTLKQQITAYMQMASEGRDCACEGEPASVRTLIP